MVVLSIILSEYHARGAGGRSINFPLHLLFLLFSMALYSRVPSIRMRPLHFPYISGLNRLIKMNGAAPTCAGTAACGRRR
jgi:hypothetical protein